MSLRKQFLQNEEKRTGDLKAGELEAINLELADYAARLKEKIERAVRRASFKTKAEYATEAEYEKAILKPLELVIPCAHNEKTDFTLESLMAMEGYRALHAVLRSEDVDMACVVTVGSAPVEAYDRSIAHRGFFDLLGMMGDSDNYNSPSKPKKPKARKTVSSITVQISIDTPYSESYLQLAKEKSSGPHIIYMTDALSTLSKHPPSNLTLMGSPGTGKSPFFTKTMKERLGDTMDTQEPKKYPNRHSVTEHPVPEPSAIDVTKEEAQSLQQALQTMQGRKPGQGKPAVL